MTAGTFFSQKAKIKKTELQPNTRLSISRFASTLFELL